MIDDATLAEWDSDAVGGLLLPRVKALIAEIRRLREELAQEPTREWYEKRCAWYGDELDRRKADLAAHRAVVRELAERTYKLLYMTNHSREHRCSLCFDLHETLAHPLVQQAREAPHA